MKFFQQTFSVQFQYKVHFTQQLFSRTNTLFSDVLKEINRTDGIKKILFVIDSNVALHFPQLQEDIDLYFKDHESVQLIAEKIIITGGEVAKNDTRFFDQIVDAVNRHGIDRHSYIAAIGGESILDLVGYAAAVSHRGIKHIRIPTTVLSQNDSGVGVKNGVNYQGKKNFLGTFSPPVAVLNDSGFLMTLSKRDWLSGMSEAVKVALIKDRTFFDWIEAHADALVNRDMKAMEYLIQHCAKLHLEHIASGDPFEFGSSRPLDFGHWSAHKVEQLSDFSIFHGEAVSMGIALDSVYAALSGFLPMADAERIVKLLIQLQLPISHPFMHIENADSSLLLGLTEFQEHLGGQLTIMLLEDLGKGMEVHELDSSQLMKASSILKDFHNTQTLVLED